jgi:hypothetical protein
VFVCCPRGESLLNTLLLVLYSQCLCGNTEQSFVLWHFGGNHGTAGADCRVWIHCIPCLCWRFGSQVLGPESRYRAWFLSSATNHQYLVQVGKELQGLPNEKETAQERIADDTEYESHCRAFSSGVDATAASYSKKVRENSSHTTGAHISIFNKLNDTLYTSIPSYN